MDGTVTNPGHPPAPAAPTTPQLAPFEHSAVPLGPTPPNWTRGRVKRGEVGVVTQRAESLTVAGEETVGTAQLPVRYQPVPEQVTV